MILMMKKDINFKFTSLKFIIEQFPLRKSLKQ